MNGVVFAGDPDIETRESPNRRYGRLRSCWQ